LVSFHEARLKLDNINITGNGWKYYCWGSCKQDVTTSTVGGTINMGGGTDVALAFVQLINNSGGGDLLILRTDDDPDYNNWVYGLGTVNTVSTLVLLNAGPPSSDKFVLNRINSCEGLFFAGGDQWQYYSFWKNTPIQYAVQSLITKRVTVGGTSAGMAIMADFPFTAQFDTITSSEALMNPYNKKLTLGNSFLHSFLMENTVTDMHYVERDRMGRAFTFLARSVQDSQNIHRMLIACDQSSAFYIDQQGIGKVLVDPSHVQQLYNQCYILIPTILPTICQPQTPLTFQNVSVIRLASGDQYNMQNWSQIDGDLYSMSSLNGVLQTTGNNGNIY